MPQQKTYNWNTYYGIYRGDHMRDDLTDTVFFSDLLPKRCPGLYESLHRILSERSIDHRLLGNTKDIWARDYMPIQASEKLFVFYKYNPDYLQTNYYRRTITNINQITGIDSLRQDGEVVDLDLVIDGGNVVRCDNKIVMTEKVFAENCDKSRSEVQKLLEDTFQCDLIFLPWDRNEILGHSDGIIHYVGDNRVLITNYADFDTAKARQFIKILEKYMEIIPLAYDVKRKHARSWAYINYLQVGKLVLVPQLGIPEDEQTLRQIADVLPNCEVIGVPALEAVRKGGALNCVSWNVATTKWNNGFMGDEYRIHGKPISRIKEDAEKEHANWQCNLGCCYFYGHGVETDIIRGNEMYAKAAKQGNAQAQFNLGLSYYKGEGLSKDLMKALYWFKKASEQGDADAQLYVGRILEEKHATNAEIVEAYRKAAEMGNSEAQCCLGYWYYLGEMGLPVDHKATIEWWQKAAAQKYDDAQYNLGLSYEYGRLFKEDKKEAVKWYKRAASRDYIPAVFQLGCCYYFGNGVRMNNKEALKCFSKAAEYDYADAVCMIGNFYYNGFVVEEDKEEAVMYYKKAIELGSEMAENTLHQILHEKMLAEKSFDDVPF